MTNYCKSYFESEDTIIYEDVFSDNIVSLDFSNVLDERAYEKAHNIMVSGSYIDFFKVLRHINELMTPNADLSQFTQLFIYYTCDGVVDCSVTLSTDDVTVDNIKSFVCTLLLSADTDRENKYTFEFTRPYYDGIEFIIETSR